LRIGRVAASKQSVGGKGALEPTLGIENDITRLQNTAIDARVCIFADGGFTRS